MFKRFVTATLLMTLLSCAAMAQDAKTVIANASKAMGADTLNSIEYTGNGADFSIGQAMTPGGPWPKFNNKTFTRAINYQTSAMRTNRVRTQAEFPQLGGGGQPLIGEVTQNQVVVVGANTPWNQQLEFILTPHGFLKAAATNNATVASQTIAGKKYNVVTFTGQNKAKVNGYINDQNLVEKVETWIDNNILGDMLWDATFTQYASFGGIQFPRRIVQRQAGWPILDWMAIDVKPNAPAAIQAAAPAAGAAGGGGGGGQQAAPTTTSKQLGPGVWMVLPAYASLVADMTDYIVIAGGGQNEATALATMAEARRLIPNKPIRYVINSHAHFDHSGGLRTYAAEGVTILTHEGNRAYFERIFAAPHTLNPDKFALSKKKAVFETVGDKKVLTDGTHVVEIYRQQGNFHNDGLLFTYLPKEKALLEADSFNPLADPNAPAPAVVNMNTINLLDNIRRLKLDVQTFVPEHYTADGRAVGMADLYKFIGQSPASSNN
jgi:glyoxylase-like metal-dependent hydrolase (beta-lactamase superfamily II)